MSDPEMQRTSPTHRKPQGKESTAERPAAERDPVAVVPPSDPSPKARALVLGLFLVSMALRFVALDGIPSGSYVDESSIGYNAYSILITGADEHGMKLPLFFKAFGEYKNPLFIYSLVPLIYVFGLSLWTVRLGAALFGLGTAVILGLITKESLGGRFSWAIGALLASLTPWLFCLSRIGFEAVTLPFFLVLGLWSWMRAVKLNSSWWLLLCGVAWALGLFSYSTARLVVPVLFVTLLGCYFREIKRLGARLVIVLVPLVLGVFLLWSWSRATQGGLVARFATISIWKDEADLITVAGRFLTNYVDYISPSFLFFTGDPNLRHHTGIGGELFLFFFPALLAGLAYAWQSRQQPLERFVLLGFLMFPLAASLTEDSSHALRTAHGAPFLVLLAAWGFCLLWNMVGQHRLLIAIFMVAPILEVSMFYHDYFSHYAERSRLWFNAGTTELLRQAFDLRPTGICYLPGVFMDDRLEVNHPYIQFLFLGRLDPGVYQAKGLEGFNIRMYDPAMSLTPGTLLLVKDAEELLTVSGKKVAIKKSLPPLPHSVELIARTPATADEDTAFYSIYRIRE
jgi:4-amino-4-deoxy-L-arabinose transferase-like glycosyltransferase